MSSRLKTTEITVTRSIAATPTEVFDVWLNPKSPGSPWFGTASADLSPN